MNTIKHLLLVAFIATATTSLLTSCCRNRGEIWDDTKTASRHVTRGIKSLGGKNGDSREVYCREDFMRSQEDSSRYEAFDYVPLEDAENNDQMAMVDVPPESPGDPGSTIPGIEGFNDPTANSQLAGVFRKVHFPYDSSLVKGSDNLNIVRDAANHLKGHQNTYIFVEGHCDQRGAEAYNLALGARRSNAIRNLLIREGVKPDHIFTISYGKERPLVLGNDAEAWEKNRRGEFRIYQR